MLIHLLILNYNGRSLLGECLPSVLRAAAASRHRCDVAVIDNDSTDGSAEWLAESFPEVHVLRQPNRGLCSFNDVVASLRGRIVVLLNNDVKLDEQCLDPLVEPLLAERSNCFLTAPRCYGFDETTYEGFRTAVLWRWGLVQATALFPGHRRGIDRPGATASAGAAMAVDRLKFIELGGFDPLFLPGRLEDLDFAYRAFLQGFSACYVPEALAWHQGMATFEARFGRAGCDRLALRNTLLWQWKNLRHPAHVARALAGLAVRWALEVAVAPWAVPQRRWTLTSAMAAAIRRWQDARAEAARRKGQTPPSRSPFVRPRGKVRREREFFEQFSPKRMTAEPASNGTRHVALLEAVPSRTAALTRSPRPAFHDRSRKVCPLP